MLEKVRVDKYLWAIRLFKTRSQAADACDKGRVKIITLGKSMGPQSIKASRNIVVGDELEVKTEARKWIIKVTGLLEKRVGYPDAIKNYEDNTPAEELDAIHYEAASFHTGKRLSKVGHPSKKARRDLEGFMDVLSGEENTEE